MKPLAITIMMSLFFLSTSAFSSDKLELAGIQGRLDAAQGQAFQTKDVSALDILISELEATENPSGTHWADYWTAYGYYHKAVFHGTAEKSEAKAKEAIKKGKQILIDQGANRNSEDFALLAMIQSFSLQYVRGMKIVNESGAAEDWAAEAIKLDPNNPRARYVAGMYDFYKPEMFGGGRKAKTILTKSLELYKAEIPNPVTPSWGFDGTYAVLARATMKKDKDKAKELVKEGLAKYPDHYELKALAEELN